jgi:hypothetical protein
MNHDCGLRAKRKWFSPEGTIDKIMTVFQLSRGMQGRVKMVY